MSQPVHTQPPSPLPVRYLRYAGVYIFTVALVAVLDWALGRYMGFDVPPVIASVVPPVVAAQTEGMWLARAGYGLAPGGAYWRAALRMTAVAAGVGVVQFALLSLTAPQAMSVMMDMPGLSLGLIGLLLCITLLLNRFSLSMGHRTDLRAQAARHNRDKGT